MGILNKNLNPFFLTPSKDAQREEIVVTARPKIISQSQIFRYGERIFCLPHRPKFSDFFDLRLHWASVVRGSSHFFVFWKNSRYQKYILKSTELCYIWFFSSTIKEQRSIFFPKPKIIGFNQILTLIKKLFF